MLPFGKGFRKAGEAVLLGVCQLHVADGARELLHLACNAFVALTTDIDGVSFQRIGFTNTGTAFFIYLAQQATTHPIGDVPKLGSITNVSFTDIAGSTASWQHSPHQGSLITGHLYNGKVYPITNLTFNNVAIAFTGGSTTTPGTPVEATPGQYPESNMFGDLPAWAYYLRHVDGIRFDASTATSLRPDTRNKLVADDVTGLVGAP